MDSHDKEQLRYKGRVLLVDDSQTNLMVIGTQLEALGCTVTTAVNGKVAIEEILAQAFDLMLLDLLMPELDGMETIRFLRAQKYTLPVVALTGKSSEEDKQKCMEAGFNGYLNKSFTEEDLFTHLDQYLTVNQGVRLAAPAKTSHAHSPDDSKPVISIDTLWETYQDTSLIKEITACFLVDNTEVMGRLAHAVEQGDFEQTFALAHKIKGSAALIEASPLSELALQLEDAAQANDKILIARVFRNTQSAFQELSDILNNPNWLDCVPSNA